MAIPWKVLPDPQSMYEEVRKHLQEMLEVGAITPWLSPWAPAVVLVQKKNGKLQFYINLHRLNNMIEKDAYSLPQIQKMLECLWGAIWLISLDLKSGYWQVWMKEECTFYTAFTVGLLGFYQCKCMPLGLTNAPATFQHLIEKYLGDLQLSWCIIYLDGIIVFAAIPNEHLTRLWAVLTKLRGAGLKLNPEKCEFFKKEIVYLGHVVCRDGVWTAEHKIEAVRKGTVPHIVTEVRSFLGFAIYYHWFLKGFASVPQP